MFSPENLVPNILFIGAAALLVLAGGLFYKYRKDLKAAKTIADSNR